MKTYKQILTEGSYQDKDKIRILRLGKRAHHVYMLKPDGRWITPDSQFVTDQEKIDWLNSQLEKQDAGVELY